jgi:hypothetical protein
MTTAILDQCCRKPKGCFGTMPEQPHRYGFHNNRIENL